uniref:reverse transcriptase domain-containing protein n=1 Tax=Limnospira platensis TaxID=118562 RepID=UPI003D6FDB8B
MLRALKETSKQNHCDGCGFQNPEGMKKAGIGIPTIQDRARQALVKSALEPEWESRFEGTSYGFRPGRSAHDAISRIYQSINKGGYYILDADIAKCSYREP